MHWFVSSTCVLAKYSYINLIYLRLECDPTDDLEITAFHKIHDPNIYLLNKNTIARKINRVKNGVCFINRPLVVGEKIYIRVAESHAGLSNSINFALTNTIPIKESKLSVSSFAGFPTERRDIEVLKHVPNLNDVCCICVYRDGKISFSINGNHHFDKKVTKILTYRPMWLVLDLCGSTGAIEILTKTPNQGPSISFLMEIWHFVKLLVFCKSV